MEKKYKRLTPQDVATALALFDEGDTYDMNGVNIASDMLAGLVKFTQAELKTLAEYKGMTVDELVVADWQLKEYSGLDAPKRKRLALDVLRAGLDMETAVEVSGLTLDEVLKLNTKR